MAGATVEIHGLPELLRKLDADKLAGKPAQNFLNRWRLSTEADAKRGAPVWRGLTRQSITSEIDDGGFPRAARVGSNQLSARWAEYGTGLLSEDPESSHRRYFPPAAALEAWALDHGFMSGGEVAFLIWRAGGTKPTRYLRTAAEESKGKIPGWLTQMGAEIEGGAGGD
jgi:hypothetical protein